MAWLRVSLIVVMLTASSPATAGGQESPGPWRFSAGGGVGFHLTGHELSDPAEPAGLAQAAVERRAGRDLWLGLGWSGAWLRGAPGGESRQALLLTLTFEPTRLLELRVGGGLAVATVVEVDGPPQPPLFGDALVAVGGEAGGALAAGAALSLPLAERLALSPGVDVLVHRVGGQTLGLIGLSARLRLGT